MKKFRDETHHNNACFLTIDLTLLKTHGKRNVAMPKKDITTFGLK